MIKHRTIIVAAGSSIVRRWCSSTPEVGQTSSSGGSGGKEGYSPVGRAISIPSGSSGGLSPQGVRERRRSRRFKWVTIDIQHRRRISQLLTMRIPIALPLARHRRHNRFSGELFRGYLCWRGPSTATAQVAAWPSSAVCRHLGSPRGADAGSRSGAFREATILRRCHPTPYPPAAEGQSRARKRQLVG